MSGIKRFRLVAILVLALATVGCNLPGTRPSKPLVDIQSPAPGATVSAGEPLVISSVATDPDGPGVARVELFVDGESVRVIESPTGALDVFDVATTWTPEAEGELTVAMVAYRKDGTPSAPATLTLSVVGTATDSPRPVSPEVVGASAADDSSSASPTPKNEVEAQGRVTKLSNIRSGPGPFCAIVGKADKGDVINLLELSKDKLWYKTDYVGQVGWIYTGTVTLLGDVTIPVGSRTGCAGCGDGACNLKETCDSCPEDCGECCGNKLCEPEYGEDCATCEADCGPCCGNGACEPERGEDCATCEADCGKCCGNGVCEKERGENCSTCPKDCGSCCGNGKCQANKGENCSTCPKDCGKCCGNGKCEAKYDETCKTCPADCGECPSEPECGDGTCDSGEDCESCPADCGECPSEPECGDGTCDSGENCTSCPDDCGECPSEPECGDGTCDSGEDCESCPADCGECPSEPECGDGTCDSDEDCESCPADCGECPSEPECGDGTCDSDEDCESCPADCGECP